MLRSALCIALGLGVSLSGLAAVAAAADITELTINEQVGVARSNEPIRMGVPLAKGVAKDVSELALTDSGGLPIPCQFVEVMRWPGDNSLRWVHVIFQASVGAKGKTTVKLVKGVAAGAGTARLAKVDVSEANGVVTVTNGQVKLVIKGANFNVFDGAWYDPSGAFGPGSEIVKPGGDGIVATLDGKPYKPGADSKVVVEEKGPLAVVIKVSGRLVNGESSPFDYVCRIHVFAGSPVVKVDFSYTNSSGNEAADKVTMSDLSVTLPVAGEAAQAAVGGEDKVYSGKAAKIVAKTSDLSEITVDEQAAGAAKGKSTKPFTIGWADLSNSDKGLAVGVRWFWQMFPKAMEAGNGKLRAGLFAKEVDKPLDVYMGQGRTHYLTFLFHGKFADKATSEFFAGTQMPLRAVASPKYYCRDTEAFGKVADADPSIYPADVAAAEKNYDDLLKKSAEYINKKIDNATYNGVTMDSYGYLAWGDVFHYANDTGVTNPWNILWESNYYDYPWACGLQFARTGDLMYVDILDRHGLNVADVFMCKWAPQKMYWGACRYSPPANFVGNDVSYKTPKPYFSVEFNHHKAQSILARYYLLGDLRAKDDFMLALNNAMTNPEASWRQSRGPGAKLATLYSGYLLTRDPKCLEQMKKCVAAGIQAATKNGGPYFFAEKRDGGLFMIGISSEGLGYYFQLTGDPATLELLKSVADFMSGKIESAKNKDVCTTNITFALSLVYRQTGDEKYKKACLDQFARSGTEQRPKGFGQHWRNCAYTWYYLSNLGEKKDTPLVPN